MPQGRRQLLDFAPRARLVDGEMIPLDFEVDEQAGNDAVQFDITLRHTGPRAVAVKAVQLFEIDLSVASLEVYRQGFFMPSDPCGFSMLQAGKEAPTSGPWKDAMWGKDDFVSHTVTVLGPSEAQGPCLLGYTTGGNYEGVFVFNTGGDTIQLSAWLIFDGTPLKPNAPVRLEQLMVIEGFPFAEALGRYATATGKINAARVPSRTVTGWVDWQYYREEKSEADILCNLDALKALRQDGFPPRDRDCRWRVVSACL